MAQFSRSFEPIPEEVAFKFVQYAGGMATGLLKRLHDGTDNHVTADELAWLVCNTSGSRDPHAMCQQLIDAYNLQCITTRLKT